MEYLDWIRTMLCMVGAWKRLVLAKAQKTSSGAVHRLEPLGKTATCQALDRQEASKTRIRLNPTSWSSCFVSPFHMSSLLSHLYKHITLASFQPHHLF